MVGRCRWKRRIADIVTQSAAPQPPLQRVPSWTSNPPSPVFRPSLPSVELEDDEALSSISEKAKRTEAERRSSLIEEESAILWVTCGGHGSMKTTMRALRTRFAQFRDTILADPIRRADGSYLVEVDVEGLEVLKRFSCEEKEKKKGKAKK